MAGMVLIQKPEMRRGDLGQVDQLWSKLKMTALSKWHKVIHTTPGLCALAHVPPLPVRCHGVR